MSADRSWANLPVFLPRGRMASNSVTASVNGVGATETVLVACLVNLVAGRRYRVKAHVDVITESAAGGQALMRLRYAAGTTVTNTSTLITQGRQSALGTAGTTSSGYYLEDDIVAASSGGFAAGFFGVQGNASATVSFIASANGPMTICVDDVGI
jgi:hypothetical protein